MSGRDSLSVKDFASSARQRGGGFFMPPFVDEGCTPCGLHLFGKSRLGILTGNPYSLTTITKYHEQQRTSRRAPF